MPLESVNPATGERLATYEEHDTDEVQARVAGAYRAHRSWRRAELGARAAPLLCAAELLEQRARQYAELMALEMGKPLADGEAEAKKCASVCRYYAEHAEAFLADEEVDTEAQRSLVAYQPLGVVLAVMPWNFPFWQVFRAA